LLRVASKRDTQPALVVHLKRTADGSAWEVHTAGPFTNIYVGKRELLWQGERSAPTRPAGQAAPSFTLPREEPGAAALPSARGQSDGDIGAAAPPRNPDPGGAAPGPDQPELDVEPPIRPDRADSDKADITPQAFDRKSPCHAASRILPDDMTSTTRHIIRHTLR
jgi:hypothetical protein